MGNRDCDSCLYEKVLCLQFGICLEDGEWLNIKQMEDEEYED